MKPQPITPFRQVALLTLCSIPGWLGTPALGQEATNAGWERHTYPEIGLTMQLPRWSPVIKDQHELWSLSAFPLPTNSLQDIPYRLRLLGRKIAQEEYATRYRQGVTNNWAKEAHPDASQKSNQFWIIVGKDIVGSNGFVYKFEGSILRFPRGNKDKEATENDKKLTEETCRVLDSIEVIDATPAGKP